jgi:hypothetical protein
MTLVLIGIESSAIVLALLQYRVARFYKLRIGGVSLTF